MSVLPRYSCLERGEGRRQTARLADAGTLEEDSLTA